MAADLSIHVVDSGMSAADWRTFNTNVLGSKYFNLGYYHPVAWEFACSQIARTSSVRVGPVAALAYGLAALSGQPVAAGEFIPGPIAELRRIIGEDLPVIDDALIGRAWAAFEALNATEYELTDRDIVLRFLHQHRGKQVFTVAW